MGAAAKSNASHARKRDNRRIDRGLSRTARRVCKPKAAPPANQSDRTEAGSGFWGLYATPPPALLSAHRLARFRRWLELSILWFAAHLLGRIAPALAARQLTRYRRWARHWLVVQAVARVQAPPARPRPAHDFAPRRRLTPRRMLGVRAIRALRGEGSLRQRAQALAAILAAPKRLIARIVRRLRRRFSKLRALPRPRRTKAALSLQNVSPAGHDTS